MKLRRDGPSDSVRIVGTRRHASVAASIGARGFRRWYERQLIDGFLHMITGVLSLIMMSIALEMLEFSATASSLLVLAAIALAGGGLCVFSWRRFHWLLSRSEHLAEQATCSRCNTYGRFEVVSSRAVVDAAAGCSIDVRCRRCGSEWTII